MLFFGFSLSIVIFISFWLYWSVTGALVRDQNPITANLWAQQHLMERHWEAFGKPTQSETLPPPGIMPPLSASEDVDFRRRMESITKRIRNRDSETSFIANPEKIREIYFNNFDENAPEKAQQIKEEWENYADVLESFPIYQPDFQPDKESKYVDFFYDDDTYHYFEEVRIDHTDRSIDCAACHQGFVQGQLMGVVHVVIPESTMKRTLQRYWAYMLGAAIVSAFLIMATVNMVIHSIVIKPLKKLREVAESISRGETAKRVEIETGDEFEVLGKTFNRMLRSLMTSQELLHKTNIELEGKVDELAHSTVQLYEANNIKSEFMATMSHELRTPLNSILGFSEVLGSVSTLTDKQKRYAENINKSGQSLLTMVNDILDVAKMEAGRMEIKPSEFNIALTVTAQTDMAKPLVDRKNIELETDIAPNLPLVKQDESRIQQILNNLLSNAVKFTPEGGRIKVCVRKEEGKRKKEDSSAAPMSYLVLTVADTGVGISEEDQQIIFEKFRQGKNTATEGDMMKREHSGSGLGLSIVREICKMLDGEISLESQLGIGSTFTILLPWRLEPKRRISSDMMDEIRQFAQNRVIRNKN